MTDEREVSNAQLHWMLTAQNKILEEIRSDVKAQNGRVQKLEQDNVRIKAYWSSAVVVFTLVGDTIKHKVMGG